MGKRFLALCCIAIFASGGCLFKKKEENDDFTLLLLLAALAGSSSGPRYEFTESSAVPSSLVSNYFGAGVHGYSVTPPATIVGPTYPSYLIQAEQNHAVGSTYIDFQQSIGAFSLTRNSPSGTQVGTVMHYYGRSTSIYSSFSATPSVNQTNNFAIIAPSNALTLTYRTVRALIPASSEENSFVADSSTADHQVRGTSRVWSSEKRINVHLIFVSGSNPAASESGISTAISKMTSLYTQSSVRIRPVFTSTTVSAPLYNTLTSLSIDSSAAGSLGGLLVSTAASQRADALNIIFVKNETAVGGVLGISGGIPGLPGKTGTRNSGMVVMFDSHVAVPGTAPNTTEQTLMGETMAHEGGHWLGLWHLVESNYNTTQNIWTRDAISETPRCTQSPVNLANCDSTSETNAGSRNVMFWAGTSGFSQPYLTGEQGWVLRRHPLAY